jgi:hydrogenase maturation factor
VLKQASLAGKVDGVHAMHDPTEGGLAMGLWELAQASESRISVRVEAIPILPEGERLCTALGLDPFASIASGALLLTCAPEASAKLAKAFARSEKTFKVIGRVEAKDEPRVVLQSDRSTIELTPPERDEIAKLFE